MATDSIEVADLKEVSSVENGGKILFATDDFFAPAENLLKVEEPLWNEEYTEFGKWMDGWESRRKRTAGHDWAIIALGEPSSIRKVCVDTAFFTGNYAPRFSLQGARLDQDVKTLQNRDNKMGTSASEEEINEANKLNSENWKTLIPMTDLGSGYPETRKNLFDVESSTSTNDNGVFTHVRLNLYPDGGVARLRIYGVPLKKALKGDCVKFSNAHYAHPRVLLNPAPSKGMHDGWETARIRARPPKIVIDDSGFMKSYNEEWVILRLEKAVKIDSIEVDTRHFKGNCPDSVKIEGAFAQNVDDLKPTDWNIVLDRTKLLPHRSDGLVDPALKKTTAIERINHVRVTIEPDGGLARVRIYGTD